MYQTEKQEEELLSKRYRIIEDMYERRDITDNAYAVLNAAAGVSSGVVTFEELMDEYTS